MAKAKVAEKQTLEQWWAEDAERLNQFAASLKSAAVKVPQRSDRDFSEWESLVDEEYRAFRAGTRRAVTPRIASNKGGGGRVQKQDPKVQFGHGRYKSRPAAAGAGRWQVRPVAGRAFCPGASPPDNSCSPANKGTGEREALARPEPDWDGSVTTGFGDPRGATTGHSESQRQEYAEATVKWLAERGVELSIVPDDKGPPTVDAMHAVMRGIEVAEASGLRLPEKIFVREQPKLDGFEPELEALAMFNYRTGEISVSPNFNSEELRFSVEGGHNAAGPERDAAPLVHELFHRDHIDSIVARNGGGDWGKKLAMNMFRDWTGRLDITPLGVRPTVDPWLRQHRQGFNSVADEDGAYEIARSVSRYAATNPVEFVAEVRTAMSGGRRFSRDVMNLYKDYLGPPIPPDDSKPAEAA